MQSTTKHAPTLLALFLVLCGCSESRWPSDIKPGVEIQWSMVGGGEGALPSGKVLRVERGWLIVEYRGHLLQLPREKVLFLGVRSKGAP